MGIIKYLGNGNDYLNQKEFDNFEEITWPEPSLINASGGDIVIIENSIYHVFTSPGTFTVNNAAKNSGVIEVLAIGAGGGGGGAESGNPGGAGGGGAVVTAVCQFSVGDYSVYVGGGGGAGASAVTGTGGGTAGTNGGGTGGNSGGTGSSGGGGGGGGWSGVGIGVSYYLVAGGGAGGGGATEGTANDIPAGGGGSPRNVYRPESLTGINGSPFVGDGGGFGGGGGGYDGVSGGGGGPNNSQNYGGSNYTNPEVVYARRFFNGQNGGVQGAASRSITGFGFSSYQSEWGFLNAVGYGGGSAENGTRGLVAFKYRFISTESSPTFTATGGSISTTGQYTYHTFTSPGIFTCNGFRNLEVVAIGAGGGSGGRDTISAGGGGAGGIVIASFNSIRQEYTVGVGGGGGGGVSGASNAAGGAGGTNGGGTGGNAGPSGSSGGGGGGGGWSGIGITVGLSTTYYYLVAGGGGGGGGADEGSANDIPAGGAGASRNVYRNELGLEVMTGVNGSPFGAGDGGGFGGAGGGYYGGGPATTQNYGGNNFLSADISGQVFPGGNGGVAPLGTSGTRSPQFTPFMPSWPTIPATVGTGGTGSIGFSPGQPGILVIRYLT